MKFTKLNGRVEDEKPSDQQMLTTRSLATKGGEEGPYLHFAKVEPSGTTRKGMKTDKERG